MMSENKKQAAKYLKIALFHLEAAEERMWNEDMDTTYHIGNAKHQIKEVLYYVEDDKK